MRKKRMRRRKQKRLARLAALALSAVLLWQGHLLVTSGALPQGIKALLHGQSHHIASEAHGWQLMLVNSESHLPEDHTVELTQLSNGEAVDARIYPALQQMFDDARAGGIYPFVREGYRTAAEQQQLLDEKIHAYRSEGYPQRQAEQLARSWVAAPGTSEHQLGLAVDINADTTLCSRDAVYSWLAENAHKYGFIQRYPADKTDITGILYEPWHYRYVGTAAAAEIYTSGLCLEEYIDTLA